MAKRTGKKKKKLNRKQKTYAAVALIVLLLVSLIPYNYLKTQIQRKHFMASKKIKETVVESIKTKAEVIQEDDDDRCSYERPEVFSDKVLYCNTYSAIYVLAKDEKTAYTLLDQITYKTSIVYKASLTTPLNARSNAEGIDGLSIFKDKKNNLDCRIEINYPATKKNTGYYLPEREHPDAMRILIGCTGQARESYFKFVPNDTY